MTVCLRGYGARVSSLAVTFCAAVLGAAGLPGSTAAVQPNVVVILTDDQGYADISLNRVGFFSCDALDQDGQD